MWELLRDRVAPALRENIRILDVGSGRTPLFAPADRPTQCVYTGLDVARAELEAAPPGSYDETVVSDVLDYRIDLAGQFDLTVSWWLLEHVSSLDRALENLRAYLRPGGRLVVCFSGAHSVAAIANRALPHPLARRLVERFTGRSHDSVFPARYDQCSYDELMRLAEGWQSWDVLSLYNGADRFAFLRPLHAAYLAFEEWTYHTDRRNLATHYLLTATV
ncbi:MAG: class I SAM-dependent methyltransferase [Actinomycetota bacterium]|nr:class I SAM-dependent methyltransferase [Actinomycetota bacterium]